MPARTVKGTVFTIVVDGKRIIVKHISSKGKRCRVIVPEGVIIISSPQITENDVAQRVRSTETDASRRS